MNHHFYHYVVLVCILGMGLVAFFLVRPNVSAQLFVGILTAAAYVLWGIIHHMIDRDLHPKIVIEYMLIGAIAVVLLLTKGGI